MAKIPYFNPTMLPEPKNEYVLWVDVSGTKSTLSRSIRAGAVSLFKLHDAILNFENSVLSIYPVMDGAYITSPSKQMMIDFINSVFKVMAECFIETNVKYRFFIKGALAFGPVIHGNRVPDEASYIFKNNPDYRAALLVGMPVIQAISSEPKASPFGVYVHESARAFAPEGEEPFVTSHWQWFKSSQEIIKPCCDALDEYFDWCLTASEFIGYQKDRIQAHKEQAKQFFAFDI